MDLLAQCMQNLGNCENYLSRCQYSSLLKNIGEVVGTTITVTAVLTIGVAAYALARYPKEIKEYIKKTAEKKEVKAFIESIEKHETYTTSDLTLVISRESNISNFGIALTSLARCIKHFVLGIFFFLPFINSDDLSLTTYFHRSFIDLGGFGIGIVGTFFPKTAHNMAGDFLKFSWKNS